MGPIGPLAASLTTNQRCVTTQKSEDLDYTEAESLKSLLADSFTFLRFLVTSSIALLHIVARSLARKIND